MMRAGLQTGSVQDSDVVPAITAEVKDLNSAEMPDLAPVRKVAAADLSASDFDQDQFYLEFEALFRAASPKKNAKWSSTQAVAAVNGWTCWMSRAYLPWAWI
ncbi:UNKNOWN [Stylonychia lemnae]|uniref:Uncharacterized protein n=1 Tax=Stylonychia lemnae TaxID=5949 RepID=A0A077ZR02_STYLE|nr:UNKNOWN [Stylonychia lemnae]|eukprot:CDW72312.1 UNKNOWN [Stylonychia lemnae]